MIVFVSFISVPTSSFNSFKLIEAAESGSENFALRLRCDILSLIGGYIKIYRN
jgi:hypothetical protein